ncbi:TetR/AcrR family transcriptional regulator [Acidaminobacter sp. JC074]|uniref:TetR/AcrR family transcriptional regulator n=1 Tax=Acidaminobacter sp. JC074 TaxID=2530199 RepID=UPI001F0FCC5B|nr:TetR/AcrR family transcriptional regulator [Acidaminobacter sp. JC074]
MNQSSMILQSARECLTKKGYAHVSLRSIANEAGVALSQLHYYYGSKKDLYKAVVMDLVNEYIEDFSKGLEASSKSPLVTFVKYVQDMVKEKPEIFKLLFDLSSLALWSNEFKTLLNNLMVEISDLIIKCIPTSNITEEYSKDTVAKALTGAIFGIALQYTLDPDENEDTLKAMSIIPEFL